MSDRHRHLIDRAVSVLERRARPLSMVIPEAHEGEATGWANLSPREIVTNPNPLYMSSQVFLMTSEGFVFLLPILLALGLLEPNNDYAEEVTKRLAHLPAGALDDLSPEYRSLCAELAIEWNELYNYGPEDSEEYADPGSFLSTLRTMMELLGPPSPRK